MASTHARLVALAMLLFTGWLGCAVRFPGRIRRRCLWRVGARDEQERNGDARDERERRKRWPLHRANHCNGPI